MRRPGWGNSMPGSKGLTPRGRRAGRARASGRPPTLETLLVEHRRNVVRSVLNALQAVEPARLKTLQQEMAQADSAARESAERRALATRLRGRRRVAAAVREIIEANRTVLDGLEDQFLPNHGVVGDSRDAFGNALYSVPLSKLQFHVAGRYHGIDWRSTVFRCVASCRLGGSECVEPAILSCLQILRALRELDDEWSTVSDDENAVYVDGTRLRKGARDFLKVLDAPVESLKLISGKSKKSNADARRYSSALQRLGLIRRRGDSRWERTPEGTLVLQRA